MKRPTMPRPWLPRSPPECSNSSAGTTHGWPRSCATTFRWSSEVGSRLDLHARPHAHAHVVVVVVVVELPQRPGRRVAYRADFVPLCRRQSVARAGAFDFAERPGRGGADLLIAVLQGADQRLDGLLILDFAQGPRRQDPHFRVVVFQRAGKRPHGAAVLDFTQRPDRRLA